MAAFIAEPVMQANGVQTAVGQLFPARPRDLRQVRRAPHRRRGDHRLRPDRRLVRERALRDRARHHDHGQGDDRRVLPDGSDDRAEGDWSRRCRSSATSTPSAATAAASRRRPRTSPSASATASSDRARDNGALLPRGPQGCARRAADRRRRPRHRHVARGRLHRRPEDKGAVHRRHGQGGRAPHEGRRACSRARSASRPSRWRRRSSRNASTSTGPSAPQPRRYTQ